MEKADLLAIGMGLRGERQGDGSPDARFSAGEFEAALEEASKTDIDPGLQKALITYHEELGNALGQARQHEAAGRWTVALALPGWVASDSHPSANGMEGPAITASHTISTPGLEEGFQEYAPGVVYGS